MIKVNYRSPVEFVNAEKSQIRGFRVGCLAQLSAKSAGFWFWEEDVVCHVTTGREGVRDLFQK